MRNLLLSAFIIPLMVFAACEKPSTETPKNENQNNEQQLPDEPNEPQQPEEPQQPDEPSVDTYKGALMPDKSDGREQMEAILSLVEEQKGAIDSEQLIATLTSQLFVCTQRFMLIHDLKGEEADHWSWGNEWVGGKMCYTLSLGDDGKLCYTDLCGCAYIDFDSYLHEIGYYGYHVTTQWTYENDTLYTGKDKKYAAKVLYFDGQRAVLEGHVVPMSLYEGEGYKVTSPEELYLFEFKDGRDTFLNGFELTYEEFIAMLEEFYANLYEGV